MLFLLGAHPFPTLVLRVLQGTLPTDLSVVLSSAHKGAGLSNGMVQDITTRPSPSYYRGLAAEWWYVFLKSHTVRYHLVRVLKSHTVRYYLVHAYLRLAPQEWMSHSVQEESGSVVPKVVLFAGQCRNSLHLPDHEIYVCSCFGAALAQGPCDAYQHSTLYVFIALCDRHYFYLIQYPGCLTCTAVFAIVCGALQLFSMAVQGFAARCGFISQILPCPFANLQCGTILLVAICRWRGIHAKSLVWCRVYTIMVYCICLPGHAAFRMIGVLCGCLCPIFPPGVSCILCGNDEDSAACISHQMQRGCHACDKPMCWNTSPQCPYFLRSRERHADAGLGDIVPHIRQSSIEIYCDSK